MNGGESNQPAPENTPAIQQQQQQWMAMQYEQWMAMQHYQQQQQQMMYSPHYTQYYHPQQQHYHPMMNQQIQNPSEDNRTIWIGDLHHWMDEAYLHSCFSLSGQEVLSVKIIRNKQTGQSERYGFIEFGSHSAADQVLQSYNSIMMPNTDQLFRLNWATFSSGDRRPEAGSDLSIFVGDLATDVTDALLLETFVSRYPSVKGAKVVVDVNSGRSKGYGFVRFGDENEKNRAITEMNGALCSSRAMRISVATPKKPSPQQQYSSQALTLTGGYASNGAVTQVQSENDSANTTIFVGGLDSDVTDEVLREYFTPYGDVASVKIPTGKGCGFVQFVNRSGAEDAIQGLNGSVIGKQTVRLSWGRNLHKQSRMDSNQWNGAYHGKQVYNGYGYAAGAPYAASSNGHGNHQQPVS